MTEPAAAALRRVVEDHGRHTLGDPAALRAALPATGTTLTGSEVDALVAVAGSDAVQRLVSATERGVMPSAAVAYALPEARESTSLPAADAERACRAFAEALGAAATPAPGRYRIDWDGPAAAPVSTLPIPPQRWHLLSRPLLVASGIALGLVAAAVLTVVLVRGTGAPAQPPPDRHAVDQVAQRYRALGATLLDGALRCAPLQPAPGELERLDCSFGAWSVVLTGYDSPSRLADARERAMAETPDAARESVTTGPDAAFAMRETAGDRATATIYWDADLPRPVSASVSTTELSLPALVAFWDARGVGTITRPEVPGAAFESAALWSLADSFVSPVDSTCGPVPADRSYPRAAEEVRCIYPNGVRVDFVLVDTAEQIYEYRRYYASPDGTVPDTLRVGGWSSGTDEVRGQLMEYVLVADGFSYLYFDDATLPAFGLMFDGRGQEDLEAFWADVSSG
jgi:hypothetical protein